VDEAMAWGEDRRAEAYVPAMHAGRNTTWNQAVRRTLGDLWDVEITDAASLLAASEKMADTGRRAGWARDVCDRVNVAALTVGCVSDNGIAEVGDRLCLMASCPLPKLDALRELLSGGDERGEIARLAGQIERGWIDHEAALYTARQWLHDAAERLYRA
jgi:hypothetical protein